MRSFRRALGPEFQVAQAVFDFARHFDNSHSILNHQLARERLAHGSSLACVVADTAVLTVFIPAKAPVRNGFRREKLKAAKERVVIGDLELLSDDGYLNQLFVRMEQWAGRAHALL